MHRSLAVIGIASLLSAPVVLGFAQQAGAASAGGLRAATPAHVVAATVPNSNIKLKGAVTKFSPKVLDVKWSGSTEKKCTDKKLSFEVTNTTSTTEQLTLGGSDFGSAIPAGESEGVCAWGTGTTSASFGLTASDSKTLTVNVS